MQNDPGMTTRQSGQAHPLHTHLVIETLKRAWRLAGGLLLLLPCALPSPASAENKADKCMAGICLEPPIAQKALVAKYGPGLTRSGPGSGDDMVTRCYYDKKQDLYVEFTFDKHGEAVYDSDLIEIMVSPVPMCPKRYAPKKPFSKLVTESGLKVGSTVAEVEAALGKPSRIDDVAGRERTTYATKPQEYLLRNYDSSAYGGQKLMYIPDPEELLFSAFYISDGKVKSVLLSVSE